MRGEEDWIDSDSFMELEDEVLSDIWYFGRKISNKEKTIFVRKRFIFERGLKLFFWITK